MKYLLLFSIYLIGISISYRPSEAVAYARRWAYSRNPAYIGFDDPDTDESASFISQCLIAGGFSTSECPGNNGKGNTFSDVPNLENCLVQKGWKKSTSMPSKGMPLGSVITFYNGGHVALVVKGGTNPLIASHTTDVYGGSSNFGYGKKYFWTGDN